MFNITESRYGWILLSYHTSNGISKYETQLTKRLWLARDLDVPEEAKS